jgi:hypothetical protein
MIGSHIQLPKMTLRGVSFRSIGYPASKQDPAEETQHPEMEARQDPVEARHDPVEERQHPEMQARPYPVEERQDPTAERTACTDASRAAAA